MYYIINKDTRELIRESETPFNVDESIQPPDPLIQLKLVNDNTEVPHDPLTQKLVREFVDDDKEFTRTFYYTVADKPLEEVESAKQGLKKRNEKNLIASELRSSKGTLEERVRRLEKIILENRIGVN